MGKDMTDRPALEGLLTDETEINETLLSQILSQYVKIANRSGLPIFTQDYARLTNAGKILVYLLTRKAAIALGLLNEGEAVTPREISEASGVAYDSVKPTLSSLARARVVSRIDGRYTCPNHILSRATQLIR